MVFDTTGFLFKGKHLAQARASVVGVNAEAIFEHIESNKVSIIVSGTGKTTFVKFCDVPMYIQCNIIRY